eukprot:5244063-Amphidinium_carterae.1
MTVAWIELKSKFEVTLKSFSHEKLDGLLHELIVKLRMRRNTSRVDTALGVSAQQPTRPGARSLEADANEARPAPKIWDSR